MPVDEIFAAAAETMKVQADKIRDAYGADDLVFDRGGKGQEVVARPQQAIADRRAGARRR